MREKDGEGEDQGGRGGGWGEGRGKEEMMARDVTERKVSKRRKESIVRVR